MKGIKFIPDDTNIDFMKVHILSFIISGMIVLASLGLVFTKGLNFGVDFTGGTVMEVRTPVAPDLAELRSSLNDVVEGDVLIQEFGAPDDLLIRLPQRETPEEQKAMADSVRSVLDERYAETGEVDYRRTEFVGPQVGKELKMQGLYAVVFAILGILAYVWFRFEWQFGVAAVIALVHDCVSILGLFAWTQMQFDLATVAAILTVAGYSINDTVVVFDRIRENLRKYKKKTLEDIFNLSVNQTLSRTVVTGLTTLLALIALWLFGGEVIAGFVYSLIWGLVIGTYSSVFIASPVLLYLNIRRSGKVAGEEAPQEG